jgi:type IV conjugative transfer system coupling protein TraD
LWALVLTLVAISGYLYFVQPGALPRLKDYSIASALSPVEIALRVLHVANQQPHWVMISMADGEWAPGELKAALGPAVHNDLIGMGAVFCTSWIAFLILLLVGAKRWGRHLGKDTLHRGKEVVTSRQIRRIVPRKQMGEYILGDTPLIRGSEVQQTLIVGGPGTGKSLIMKALLRQFRKLDHKVVIYDPTRDFLADLSLPGDKILNPLDLRSQRWDPWAEIRDTGDSDRVAAAMIPLDLNSDLFWVKGARSVLATVLNRIPEGQRTAEKLSSVLIDLEELGRLVHGTQAAIGLSDSNPKMAVGVQATLAIATTSLQYLWAGDGPVFSLRDWVARDDNSWLFLGAPDNQQEALKPLLSCWVESFASAVLSLPSSRERRIMVVLDEFATLHKLDAIPNLLAQGRKYGVAGFLGIQNFAQLRKTYGPDGADALAGLCKTFVTLSLPDFSSAEWASRNLGEIDVTESQEQFSYGAGNQKDNLRLSEMRKPRPVVSPTEIQQLPNLKGYLRLVGPYPVVKISVPLVKRPPVCESFMPIDKSCLVLSKYAELPPLAPPDASAKKGKRH